VQKTVKNTYLRHLLKTPTFLIGFKPTQKNPALLLKIAFAYSHSTALALKYNQRFQVFGTHQRELNALRKKNILMNWLGIVWTNIYIRIKFKICCLCQQLLKMPTTSKILPGSGNTIAIL